jgi:hypothetical protein
MVLEVKTWKLLNSDHVYGMFFSYFKAFSTVTLNPLSSAQDAKLVLSIAT